MPRRPLPAEERLRALLVPAPAPSEEPPSVLGALRGAGYDPGRRGALALVAVGVVAAVIAAVVLLRGRGQEEPLVVPPVAGASAAATGPEVVVDVEGKVRHPGLVRLPDGSRVDDALRRAGGVLPGVSTAGLNLAQKVTDGQQLLVGLTPVAPGGPGTAGAAAGGLVNLNLATVADFDGLPGIGPVLAQRIVDWRTEHGHFASVDQLQEVSGIGAAKYATLKSKVTV